MHRRQFLKLSPAAAAASTATLTLHTPGAPDEPLDVRVLRLQPGDVVLLSAPGCISCETARRLTDYMQHALPDGVRAMVLGDGLRVDGVLRGPTGTGGDDLHGGKG